MRFQMNAALQLDDSDRPTKFHVNPLLLVKEEDRDRLLLAIVFEDMMRRTHLQFCYALQYVEDEEDDDQFKQRLDKRI